MIKRLKVVLMGVLLACVATLAAGCTTDTADENGKYDIAIRVSSQVVDENGLTVGSPRLEVEFAPNESEKTIELNDSGRSFRFIITEYKLVGHPTKGEWVTTKSGPHVFYVGYPLYWDLEGKQHADEKFVKEKGKYIYSIHVDASPASVNPSPSWDFRACYLTVIVK